MTRLVVWLLGLFDAIAARYIHWAINAWDEETAA